LARQLRPEVISLLCHGCPPFGYASPRLLRRSESRATGRDAGDSLELRAGGTAALKLIPVDAGGLAQVANLGRADADVPVVGPVADECVKLGHRPGGLLARSDDEADVGRNAKSLALACPAAQIARRGPRIRRAS